MLLKPLKKRQPLLGIDISSSAVKVVELSLSNQGYKVEHYGAEPLAANTMTDRIIADVEGVGEAIRRAVRKSGSRLKKAVVAVGGAQIMTTTIVLPGDLEEQDMHEQIDLQLDQHVALSRDEVSYDFDVVGPNKSDPTQVNVLLVATRREYVEKNQAALEIAGLSAAIVDIETHALDLASQLLEHQMPNRGAQKLVAVVDFGATLTTFCLRDDHKMAYMRDQSFGGRMLTEEIMRFYGLSFEEAGLAKRREGLPKSYRSDVLEPFMDEMAKQIRTFSRQYQESTGNNRSFDQIILCGGCSQIPGVADYIGQQLSIPTVRGNPLASTVLAAQPKSAKIEQDAPSLMIALGLAMRSFL